MIFVKVKFSIHGITYFVCSGKFEIWVDEENFQCNNKMIEFFIFLA